MAFILDPRKTHPMEAKIAEALPAGKAWQFEPKWDGFRCLAFRDGKSVALYAKSGKPLTVYFREIAEAVAALKPSRFVLDGELVIPVGGKLSFDALQARLHPAESRQKKLARETPALLVLFDILADEKVLLALPLEKRRAHLEALVEKMGKTTRFRLSPYTREVARAKAWLKAAGQGALDGVIAKPLGAPYAMGERTMLKVKHLKTADCVVGGFRYATGSQEVGSLLLGLYDEAGKLNHVGFTSGIPAAKRAALTKRLEALKGEGFTGDAPGGPSRWSTERSGEWVKLKPKLVAEVRYDHITGGRFRHGTRFMRWRPDKPAKACGYDQLKVEARPSRLIETLLEAG